MRYILQVDTTDSFSTLVFIDTSEFVADTVNLLEGYYYWRVSAYDLAGNVGGFSSIWEFGIDMTPPQSFNLISPEDSVWLSTKTPDFIWHSSSDVTSGIRDYLVYIDGSVKDSTVDSTWNCAYDLSEGNHSWFIEARDVAGLHTQSDDTFVVSIDTTSPSSFDLVSPSDSLWINISKPEFIWRSSSDPLSGLKDYKIYIDGSPADSILDTIWICSYDLSEGDHDWYVIAYDITGNLCQSSDTWIVRVDTTQPLIPVLYSPDSGLVTNQDVLEFIWCTPSDNLSGINCYDFEYDIDSLFTNSTDTLLTDTTVTISFLDTIYYWRVYARDNADNIGDWSDIWWFEVDTHQPEVPEPLNPDSAYLNVTQVIFQWTEVTKDWGKGFKASPVNYVLEVDTTESFNTPNVDTTEITLDTLILPESWYYWHIKAYDEAGNESQFSECLVFVVDTTVPEVVTLTSPDSGLMTNDSIITFIWYQSVDSLSGIEHYIIQYADNLDFISPVDTEVIDTNHIVTLSDTTYYWRVQAIDRAGNENEWSDVWSLTIDTQIPDIPNLTSPTDSSILSDNTPVFIWSKVTKNTIVTKNKKGSIFMNKATDIIYTLAIVPGNDTIFYQTADTVYIPDDTLSDSIYIWQVQAEDEAGNKSGYSEPFTLFIDTQAPEIESTTVWCDTSYSGPFSVFSTIIDKNEVNSAELWYKTSIDTNWINIIMDTTETADHYLAEIPQQPESTEVYYYIYAQDNATPSNQAKDPQNAPDSCYFFNAGITGIMEEKLIPKVYFLSQNYPNPFVRTTKIKFGLPKDSYVNVNVYNISGQRIATLITEQREAGYYEIYWNALDDKGIRVPPGVYFYRLETEDFCKTRKMILLR